MAILKCGIKDMEKATEIVVKTFKPKDLRIAKTLSLFYDGKKNIAQYLPYSESLVLFGIK